MLPGNDFHASTTFQRQRIHVENAIDVDQYVNMMLLYQSAQSLYRIKVMLNTVRDCRIYRISSDGLINRKNGRGCSSNKLMKDTS